MTGLANVLILGYGEMGHAMETLLKGQCQLSIWDRKPHVGRTVTDLSPVAQQADLIVFCLPVNPHQEILKQLKPLIDQQTICLSIAKGLDESGLTAAQIFEQGLGKSANYAVLYGPMISEEIRVGHYAFAQLACSHQSLYEPVRRLFSHSRLLIESSDDMSGISWSVILKNVYAMAFGIADELVLGDNMRGYLSVAALHELNKIVQVRGGDSGSPFHLAGLGDLITTATSEDSHHHELGRRLARGEVDDIQGEGVHTLAMVARHKLFVTGDYPLFRLIGDIVKSPVDVEQKIDAYLRRQFDPPSAATGTQ